MTDSLIGKEIGSFTILEEIGRGGMATVYSAMQRSMNRKVAVKILPQHFSHDPDFLERFEREVEVISALEHPHILPIYDYGEAEGMPFIAMRYMGGSNLSNLARQGASPLSELVKPMRQIAEALDYAHQQGIIHRDIKPGNIMLDKRGNAYLSDFGIARVMGGSLAGGAIIGTPAYMSPEQAHGVNIDARSDIYSLGIVLFELITGREPYQAHTPMSLLMMQINEPIPDLSDFVDNIPSAVQAVLNTATAKNPDDRYNSASEFIEAFQIAIGGKSAISIHKASNVADTTPQVSQESGVQERKTTTEMPASVPQQSTKIATESGGTLRVGIMIAILAIGGVMFAVFALISPDDSGTGGEGASPLLIFISMSIVAGSVGLVFWQRTRQAPPTLATPSDNTPAQTIAPAPKTATQEIDAPRIEKPETTKVSSTKTKTLSFHTITVGDILNGRYEIKARLDQGDRSKVFHGYDTKMGRDVAIKSINAMASGSNQTARFKRESQVLSRLHHANIVPFFDYDSDGDINYIVMPMLTGGSLRRRTEEAFSLYQFVDVIR